MCQGKKWRYGRFLSNCHLLQATYKTYKGGCIKHAVAFSGVFFVQSCILHIFTHVISKMCGKGKSGAMGGF